MSSAEQGKSRPVTGSRLTEDEIIDDRMFDCDGRVWLQSHDRPNGYLAWPSDAPEYVRSGSWYMTQDTIRQVRELLSNRLKAANKQAEHFEREWYLRGDRIEELERQLSDDAILIREYAKLADREMCRPMPICNECDGLREENRKMHLHISDWKTATGCQTPDEFSGYAAEVRRQFAENDGECLGGMCNGECS